MLQFVFTFPLDRSTTNIVKAAQKVISNPSNGLSPQDSVRQDMKPMRGKGPSPRVLACADAKAEGKETLFYSFSFLSNNEREVLITQSDFILRILISNLRCE